jgi:hypothetical protein
MLFERILKIVQIKLIEPKILLAPAKCKEKIAKSTQFPGCPKLEDKGGYTVHPVPAPDSIIVEETIKIIAPGRSQ